jgi:hypothetical protein
MGNQHATAWPALPYQDWGPTLDTVHAHTQVLGKLAVGLAPPEPQLQHAALRLTARGWETYPLPAPDRSGALVATLDLHEHAVRIEHSDGRGFRIPVTPDRAVGDVTREVLAELRALVGPVRFDPRPQEVPWSRPLDEDDEHATYDEEEVASYFTAATKAAALLAEVRAPYRGRVTPVNAWWGSFDIAVNFFSGRSADPPSSDFIMRNAMDVQEIAIGWWPGDARYPRAAFYAYAHPAPPDFGRANLEVEAAQWNESLGEYVLDWDDVRRAQDPWATVLAFGRSTLRHGCAVCGWDPALAETAQGKPPPVS